MRRADLDTVMCQQGDRMAKKIKRLCKWKEDDISKKFDKFTKIVSEPKFACKKCGRVADKKKWLHKAVSLEQEHAGLEYYNES